MGNSSSKSRPGSSGRTSNFAYNPSLDTQSPPASAGSQSSPSGKDAEARFSAADAKPEGFAPPPPAYSEAPSSSSRLAPPSPASPSNATRRKRELPVKVDDLRVLGNYDTIFLIDDSGSMKGKRWEQACVALRETVELAAEWDSDGVDIHFLNSTVSRTRCNQPETVNQVFGFVSPSGLTPTGRRLKELVAPYIDIIPFNGKKNPKPRNYIVITDGVATDKDKSEQLKFVILDFMRQLDKRGAPSDQLGIQFLQVGNDESAAEALQDLDDGLAKEGSRDMVDTFPFDKLNGDISQEHIVKILVGSVNRRVDRHTPV